MLARAAAGALGSLFLGLTLVVVAIAAIGVLGTRASTRLGITTASDELTTSAATGKLAQDMDAAYATGEATFLASTPARQSQLLGSLYTAILPATDTQLAYFDQLHAGDPPAEHADIEQFASEWAAVRDLLSPTDVTGHPDPRLAARLMTAYQPVNAHLNELFLKAQHDGHTRRPRWTFRGRPRAVPGGRPCRRGPAASPGDGQLAQAVDERVVLDRKLVQRDGQP